jgi:putative DNA primase/helicase
MWEKFLSEVFSSNSDIIPFMQRLLGHALIGQVYEHIFPVFWGVGRNGKGTMLEVIKAVLGEYAGAVPKESIMSHKIKNASGAARADIMDFQGKRLMWASETDEGKNLDVSKVKWLTGGDTLKGRAPYGKRMIEFAPSHTLFLITNHKPRIGGDDQAIFDRLRLIPFIERFVDDPQGEHEHKADKFLKEKLLSEASGILAWRVRGCIEWQKDRKFNAPDVVKNLTDEYQHEEDTIFQFIDQCCVVETEHVKPVGEETLASKVYEVFTNWMKSQGLFAWSNKRFSASMEQKGYRKGRRAAGIFYQGVFVRQDL